MSIFKEATNESAYLKLGIKGFPGSGKTFTSALFAIGLYKMIKSKKPVAFLDTETGSDYVLSMFDEAKIKLVTSKSRAFVDLLDGIREVEHSSDILIIDSITHFYNELVQAFLDKKRSKHLTLRDWQPIKAEWKQFSELYVNSKLHILMLGRSGFTYDFKTDDEGITEIQKTGTKMRAETDLEFEPSLSIEMERVNVSNDKKIGQMAVNRCWIIKDRFNVINGKHFDNPTFESILPHVAKLNLGGSHVGVETEQNSQDIFEGSNSRGEWLKRRDIALENLQNELIKMFPGQTAADKRGKLDCLEKLFKTGSWTAIENKKPEEIEGGILMLKEMAIKKQAEIDVRGGTK